MADYIDFKEMLPLMIKTLETEGEITFTVTGNSMSPMLSGSVDTVTLVKPIFPLKKYDIPFYSRGDGKLILHRIVAVHNDSYIIRGDNCSYTETDITKDNIIALVSSFTHKGKLHTVNEIGYRLYCALWCNAFSFLIRKRVFARIRRIPSKVKRLLSKK